MHAVADPSALQARLHRWSALWPGLALAAAVAATAILAARLPALQALGMGALTLAIVFGIALGNSVFPRIAARSGAGVDFAKGMLLRTGIVLYGFRVTFQDIAGVGVEGVLIAMVMVGRSEEHTSELQSLMRISYAVFCLKKKTNRNHTL